MEPARKDVETVPVTLFLKTATIVQETAGNVVLQQGVNPAQGQAA